ncbi:Hypothetical_protein [Hexamita inflata]|uniref:Hypothetical_protein n=1 Tax=Hexamita inflata TaxID=28002 RepID=A0AA86N6G9_9EUKA|nr:Hypothetical protein HINF_LOCUS1419 [Hexamita inflata]
MYNGSKAITTRKDSSITVQKIAGGWQWAHIKNLPNSQNLLNQIGKYILIAHSNRTLSCIKRLNNSQQTKKHQYNLDDNHAHKDTANNQTLEITISKNIRYEEII